VLLRAKKAANHRHRRFNLVLSPTSLVERAFEITGVLENSQSRPHHEGVLH
jgi:hypothetical protein